LLMWAARIGPDFITLDPIVTTEKVVDVKKKTDWEVYGLLCLDRDVVQAWE
jgi:hypothetical protein